MNIHTLHELKNLTGKYVLLRDDFNVQIIGNAITDLFRIEQSLPTIRALSATGAKIVIMSHLGRPKGKENPELSLCPVALALEQLLGKPVLFKTDCLGRDFLSEMKNGDVALLENLRFHSGEESNDLEFARKLADGFDYYVNDAFAVSHRAHASVEAITNYLPSFAGELLSSEIAALSNLMENPKRPLVGIIGGAKVASKIGVIKSLAKLCDKLIIAGGLGTSFRIANGGNARDQLYDPSLKAPILEIMKEYSDKIILPDSKGVGKTFDVSATRVDKMFDDILPDDIIMDEGPESIAIFKRAIDGAKTIVWNGTVGMAEWQPTWSAGTFALANFIANKTQSGELESVIGGGDTAAALEALGIKDKMSYVSTGGGAFLEFIEGLSLPGIKALEK
ncbi:MAG: phosphoglycerate kinase [Rickettsiales bacterium]|jgi:phosphoglycerate kinase|nr:phosphoglycerate kinase [Rickettsiales bacterium]